MGGFRTLEREQARESERYYRRELRSLVDELDHLGERVRGVQADLRSDNRLADAEARAALHNARHNLYQARLHLAEAQRSLPVGG